MSLSNPLSEIDQLEQQLDSFDSSERKTALLQLVSKVKNGEIAISEPNEKVNLHCHSFFFI